MNKNMEDMEMCTFDDMLNNTFGVKGTLERDEYEKTLLADIESEEKCSLHITLPVKLRKSIEQRASSMGQSISAYINSVMARDVSFA